MVTLYVHAVATGLCVEALAQHGVGRLRLVGVYCGLTSMRPRSMTIRITRDLFPLIFDILTLLVILFVLLLLLLQDHLSALVFSTIFICSWYL